MTDQHSDISLLKKACLKPKYKKDRTS